MIYRTIETSTWDDERVKKLHPLGKLLFVYLITNRHAHVSGIYYLSAAEAADETGLTESRADTLLDTLSHSGLIAQDRVSGVIWVKKMLDKQGRGKKNSARAAAQLKTLHKCSLIKDFLEFYKHRHIPYTIPYTDVAIQEQEQDQEQEQEKDIASPAEKASGTKPPSGKATTKIFWSPQNGWLGIMEAHRSRWATAYPACNLDRQLASMDSWARANPKKAHKSNWEKFITNWLTREQDKGGDLHGTSTNRQYSHGAVGTVARAGSGGTRPPDLDLDAIPKPQ